MIVDRELLYQQIFPKVEKPAQYSAAEYHVIHKDWQATPVTMCFAFPDLYEIGMSHLGLRLLYETINNHSPYLMERSFMPMDDMIEQLRAHQLPLFSWESRHALADFDIIGFTLQYELSYTNILAMLDLAGIPLLASARGDDFPLVIAGGPCAYNPEPLADFIDLFVIGEGEEVTLELLDLFSRSKQGSWGKAQFLQQAAQISGIYVPSLYQASYKEDGRFAALTPIDAAPATINKRLIMDLDHAPFPAKPLMPSIKPVHDRIMLEIMRGCTRGCRFCQAGMIYRPLREKSAAVISNQAALQASSSGYDEMVLLSLSSADYSDILPLMEDLLAAHSSCGINISLPSLRVDAISVGLAARTQEVRKSGLTLAPEAGSQHLRDVINKGVTEEDILAAVSAAFSAGYTSLKLYFMIGLPYEMEADILAIAELLKKVIPLYKKHKPAASKKPLKISLGVSSFVPKPHTPFAWLPQDEPTVLQQKQQLLKEAIRPLKCVSLHFHDVFPSALEAAFARGDRRLGRVLLAAYQNGCHMDGWSEHFNINAWNAAFTQNNLTAADYAGRHYAYGEPLPWQHIACGVTPAWLWEECQKASRGELTADCRNNTCNDCGICAGGVENILVEKRKPQPRLKQPPKPEQELFRYRLRIAVEGPLIWLSHLDLLAAFEKALRRSGLAIAYSQGFNPHMLISWGPAHPVGLASDSEYLDITMTEQPAEGWQKQLIEALPPGIKLISAKEIAAGSKSLMASINYLAYQIDFFAIDLATLPARMAKLLAEPAIFIERNSPKGRKTVDIRPAIASLTMQENSVYVEVFLDRGATPKAAELAALLAPETSFAAKRCGMFINQDGQKLLP